MTTKPTPGSPRASSIGRDPMSKRARELVVVEGEDAMLQLTLTPPPDAHARHQQLVQLDWELRGMVALADGGHSVDVAAVRRLIAEFQDALAGADDSNDLVACLARRIIVSLDELHEHAPDL